MNGAVFPASGSNSFPLMGLQMQSAVCPFSLGIFFFLTESSLEKEKELQVSLVSGAIVPSNCSKDRELVCFLDHPYCKVLLPLVPSSFPPINTSVFPVPVITGCSKNPLGAEEAASSRLRGIITGEICY